MSDQIFPIMPEPVFTFFDCTQCGSLVDWEGYRSPPPAIRWNKRYYVLQDGTKHFPGGEEEQTPGPFCIRWRETDTGCEGLQYDEMGGFILFSDRGEAQEFCDWLNRKWAWAYHWVSPKRGRIEAP